MKKTLTICLVILNMSAVFAQKNGKTEDELSEKNFSIIDIFSYNAPKIKKPGEKRNSFDVFSGYNRKTGNTDSENFNYSASYSFDDNITEFQISYSGSYGKSSGETIENQGSLGLNLDHYILYRLEIFSFTFSEYNRITDLDHRNSSGIGLKFVFFKNRYLQLDLSGAPLYQYEKISNEAEKEWRLSGRGRLKIMPGNRSFSLSYRVFYIPLIEDMDIYRVKQNASLDLKIFEYLTLRIFYEYEYNTYNDEILKENPDLKKTDHSINIQFGVKI